MLIYIIIGVGWSWWLESYTTKHLEGVLGSRWQLIERIFHITVWPASLGTFIFAIIKELFKRK